MDKSWMTLSRVTPEYENGVDSFLDFAFKNSSLHGMILCPCVRCVNSVLRTRNEVKEHVIVWGFIKGYTYWIAHGELTFPSQSSSNTSEPNASVLNTSDNLEALVGDVFGGRMAADTIDAGMQIPNSEAKKFYQLIDASQQELYPGCRSFTSLSFTLRLLHLKCIGNWSNEHFNMLLDLLRSSYPEGVQLPKTYYEAEKIMKELGLGYDKIDACPNDCTLYWGEEKSGWKSCPTCQHPRWVISDTDTDGSIKKIAHKSLWHFPLKPRLQRLFMSSKTASSMRWHDEGRIKDGCMRHPADSPAWKTFDFHHRSFSRDSRNVRLGLAADGFNPFKNMNTSHSTLPVILIPYNLPPWMCMKQPYFILSLLVPGPNAPGNNLDVYLEPLMSELNDLWENGLETYDASRKENFQLRAALLWTISDFPGFANLSGWSTKGKLACPICNTDTCSLWLKNSKKHCYMGHRRLLHTNHRYRRNRRNFDGKQELGKLPPRKSGSVILKELEGFKVRFGKQVNDNPKLHNWLKNSIFNQLPYWKDNLLPYNLDPMHIEKNVSENIWGTLLDIDGMTKDHYKSRCDLKDMGIRPELHPVTRDSGKAYLPPSQFSLSREEKRMFCEVLKKVKVPDGYARNISRCVQLKPPKISGLKSHDNHILMQQLLPLAIRKILPKSVRYPLLKLSRYFRNICSKEINPQDLPQLEEDIAVTLCELEMVFPPSFFDIMVHLTVHLATQVRIGGPVHYRWMYPIERYLRTLKSYVRNSRHPDASIAKGYAAAETLTFCSKYLADYIDAKFNHHGRNESTVEENYIGLKIFSSPGRAIGRGIATRFEAAVLKKAHQYVLFNCDHVQPYIELHHKLVQRQNCSLGRLDIERIHSQTFAEWFTKNVGCCQMPEQDEVGQDLMNLAFGPNDIGLKYEKFIVNGFRFHTKDIEQRKKTQNSGVTVSATTNSFSDRRDQNPLLSEVDYYGILKSIIELVYQGGRRVVLFECDWVSGGSRLKKDENGFLLANFTNVRPHCEPFILASQASQVFYVDDPTEKDWKVVLTANSRSTYKMHSTVDVETYLQSGIANPESDMEDEITSGLREGIQGVEVEI